MVLSLLSLMQILLGESIVLSDIVYKCHLMRSQNQKIHGGEYIQLRDIKEARL